MIQCGRISVLWDNEEKTILRKDYKPGWTWTDYQQQLEASQALVSEVGYAVPLINIYEPGTHLPKTSSPFPHLQRGKPTEPLAIVTTDRLVMQELRALLQVIGFIEGSHYRFFPTLDDARQWLQDYLAQIQ